MLTKRLAIFVLVGLLLPVSVPAQQPIVYTDQRINALLAQSLQAQLNLYEGIIKAQREDAARREAEWAAYSSSLWRLPSVSEAK